jgi:two-component system response regulator FixJ
MVEQTVFLVDDDDGVRKALTFVLQLEGFTVRSFSSATAFLQDDQNKCGCLITDVRMPDIDGLQLQQLVVRQRLPLSIIIMTGHGDVPIAVEAMQAGAADFLEKPFDHTLLVTSVRRALELNATRGNRRAEIDKAKELLGLLTARERSVLEKLTLGQPNKIVAHELGISIRTVEVHRANIMRKTRAQSLSDLVRIAIAINRNFDVGHPS